MNEAIIDELVNEQPRWKLRTLKEAYQERKPTEYIVDKFFATHSLNVVYGAPGSMKSMILADMCIHVVSGFDWLPGVDGPGSGIKVTESPIIWLDMDNGERRTDERFSALGKQAGLSVDVPLYYVSMPNPSLVAHDTNTMLMFRDIIMEREARLVVIDNLGLVTGDAEENSAKMAQIMGNLRALAERTGIALILVHHQRKGGAGTSRAGDALRGHSSIEAALDLALHVVREKNANQITIRSTKTRGVDVPTVTARFHYDHIPGTNDLRHAHFDGLPVIRGENPIRDAIIEILDNSTGMTKGLLTDRVHDALNKEYGVNKIRNWIAEMIQVTKEIECKPGNHGAQILRITDEKIPF